MDDKRSVIKRQVERGNTIDEKARDIYRIAILVVSIIVAAAAVNFDPTSLIVTLLYDTGTILGTDKSSLVGSLILNLGIWALLPSLVFVIIILLSFALSAVTVIWLFFVPSYYAVRAQASAPISSNEQTWELIEKDTIDFFKTYLSFQYIPKIIRTDSPDNTERRIISEIDKESEEYDGLDDLVEHNTEILSDKRENISRAKDSTQRFFISIMMLSSIVIFMVYV